MDRANACADDRGQGVSETPTHPWADPSVSLTGARSLAYEYILPRVPAGASVLDVGAGRAPLARLLRAVGCRVMAVDSNIDRLSEAHAGQDYPIHAGDVRKGLSGIPGAPWDVIATVYASQHCQGAEARLWANLRDVVAPDGLWLWVGRHTATPRREVGRSDPCNGYGIDGLYTLAHASGWGVESASVRLGWYNGGAFGWTDDLTAASVMCATLRPLLDWNGATGMVP